MKILNKEKPKTYRFSITTIHRCIKKVPALSEVAVWWSLLYHANHCKLFCGELRPEWDLCLFTLDQYVLQSLKAARPKLLIRHSMIILLLFFLYVLDVVVAVNERPGYIWIFSALPIALMSHGSHKALSNYNLGFFFPHQDG